VRIIQFTAENVKKLKLVDITPKGDVVQITGKNGNGKSSVLDSIWWALGGEKNIEEVPIRNGADSGRIRLDLGDMIVERIFRASGTTSITVRDKTGAPDGTPDKKLPLAGGGRAPQALLDALVGRMTFDPLAFERKSQKEQYEELKSVVNLSVDIDALAAANEVDRKARTDLNREAKAKHAQADGIIVPADTPETALDEGALITAMQDAAQHNASIETRKAARQRVQDDIPRLKAEGIRHGATAEANRKHAADRIADLQRQIESARLEGEAMASSSEDAADKSLKAAAELEKKLSDAPPLPEPIDLAGIRFELDTAKRKNAQVAQRERAAALRKEAVALDSQSEKLSKQIAAREKQSNDALKSAKMPVEGLSLAGRVMFNGLPFGQASDAERLRVSVGIAMAANPSLRVIRIKNGSLLDEDNLALLAKLAHERDYQVWVETVQRGAGPAIVMEDGEVKS
jgi:energy-coupling factor transporter ATP-binding protein EcfA2